MLVAFARSITKLRPLLESTKNGAFAIQKQSLASPVQKITIALCNPKNGELNATLGSLCKVQFMMTIWGFNYAS